jgi:hypothetical protein
MCATIGMLTSRADNIAFGTSGYAHRPAGPSIAIAAGRSGEGLLEEAIREVGRQRRTRKATPRNTNRRRNRRTASSARMVARPAPGPSPGSPSAAPTMSDRTAHRMIARVPNPSHHQAVTPIRRGSGNGSPPASKRADERTLGDPTHDQTR